MGWRSRGSTAWCLVVVGWCWVVGVVVVCRCWGPGTFYFRCCCSSRVTTSNLTNLKCFIIKGTVNRILSNPSCKEGTDLFTTVHLKLLAVHRVKKAFRVNMLNSCWIKKYSSKEWKWVKKFRLTGLLIRTSSLPCIVFYLIKTSSLPCIVFYLIRTSSLPWNIFYLIRTSSLPWNVFYLIKTSSLPCNIFYLIRTSSLPCNISI